MGREGTCVLTTSAHVRTCLSLRLMAPFMPARLCTLFTNPQAQFNAVLDAAAAANLLEQQVLPELRDTAAGKGSAGAAGATTANGAAAGGSRVAAAGGIGGAGVPAFKSAMAAALKEFFNSADAQEVAARCVICGSSPSAPVPAVGSWWWCWGACSTREMLRRWLPGAWLSAAVAAPVTSTSPPPARRTKLTADTVDSAEALCSADVVHGGGAPPPPLRLGRLCLFATFGTFLCVHVCLRPQVDGAWSAWGAPLVHQSCVDT